MDEIFGSLNLIPRILIISFFITLLIFFIYKLNKK